jgi:prepilin-type processing-associated H-X9-DG protein
LTIALCEVQKTASAGFDIDDPFYGPARQVLYAGHGDRSSYLFCDWHVKSLRPVDMNSFGTNAPNLWYGGYGRPLSQNARAILKRTGEVFSTTEN